MRIFSPLAICVYASIGLLLCVFAGSFWIAELAIHWRLHMAGASLLITLIFLITKQRIYTVWMAILCLTFAIPAIQAFAPINKNYGQEIGRLTILQFNVLYKNKEFPKAVSWIIEQNADIVVLQEVNKARADELEELKKHYSWSQIKLNDNREAFGMAIFSNKPVSKFSYVDIDDGWNHYTLSKLNVNDVKIHLYELHTPPPISQEFAWHRNMNMELIADVIAKDTTSYKILIGDMNSTIYSPHFQNMAKKANLQYGQSGFNIAGTWPSSLLKPLRIGIDHLLVSPNIKIDKSIVAGYLGSDHLPVLRHLIIY